MSRRVVVIGGGVIGLFCAYSAARAGFAVTVLEREKEDHWGCSTGNAGMIVPSHFVPLAAPGMVSYGLRQVLRGSGPFGLRLSPAMISWGAKFAFASNAKRAEAAKPILAELNLLSRQEYIKLEEDLGDFGLTQKGLLMLCQTQEALDAEAHLAEEAPHYGMPVSVLDQAKVQQLDPGIAMKVAGGVYFPQDAHLNPSLLLPLLRQRLLALGVTLEYGAEVLGARPTEGKVRAVLCDNREWEAHQFVLAAGSWSDFLGKVLGLNMPMMPGKGYSFDLPTPPQMPTICSVLVEGRVAVTPMSHGLRVAGTMELGAWDNSINEARVLGIRQSLSECFPKLNLGSTEGVKVWSGLRPCSPDGLPYLGRPSHLCNLVVAAGHAMMGLSLGPITGRLVGELLSESEPSVSLDLLGCERF